MGVYCLRHLVYRKGDDSIPMSEKKTVASIIVLLTLGVLVASVPPARAQFVLASWDYPDQYGQGVRAIAVYENSTGSWVTAWAFVYYDTSTVIRWNASVGIKLRVWSYFNSTLTGAISGTDGKNYLQHAVTVTNNTGQTVFSQQNFTFYSVDDGAVLYEYFYDVVLDFLPVNGQVYTATITYEIFW